MPNGTAQMAMSATAPAVPPRATQRFVAEPDRHEDADDDAERVGAQRDGPEVPDRLDGLGIEQGQGSTGTDAMAEASTARRYPAGGAAQAAACSTAARTPLGRQLFGVEGLPVDDDGRGARSPRRLLTRRALETQRRAAVVDAGPEVAAGHTVQLAERSTRSSLVKPPVASAGWFSNRTSWYAGPALVAERRERIGRAQRTPSPMLPSAGGRGELAWRRPPGRRGSVRRPCSKSRQNGQRKSIHRSDASTRRRPVSHDARPPSGRGDAGGRGRRSSAGGSAGEYRARLRRARPRRHRRVTPDPISCSRRRCRRASASRSSAGSGTQCRLVTAHSGRLPARVIASHPYEPGFRPSGSQPRRTPSASSAASCGGG